MSASTSETEVLAPRSIAQVASGHAGPGDAAMMAEPVIIRYDSTFRKVLSASVFPGMMVVSMTAYFWLVDRGFWPPLVILGVSFVAMIVLTILEIVHPHSRYWVPHGHDVRADAIHMFTSELLPYHLYQLLFNGLLVATADKISAVLGFDPWPHDWPLLVQLALLLILMEFSQTCFHRATHTFPFLWRLHAIHHTSPKLYWLASIRFHPLENWLAAMMMVTPVVLLGANIEVMLAFSMFINIFGTTQHANVSMTPTPLLNYIFAMPELHRWHHSKDMRCNYGGYLSIWDVVFGTRYMPETREQQPDNIGIEGSKYPKNWAGHILAPFRDQRRFYEGKAQEEKATSPSSNHRAPNNSTDEQC
jgi:ornithine lipid hydroxylase